MSKSKVCAYCTMDENGDIPMGRKDLFRLKCGILFGREITLAATILRNTIFFASSDKVCAKDIHINFCPMCGRELGAGK